MNMGYQVNDTGTDALYMFGVNTNYGYYDPSRRKIRYKGDLLDEWNGLSYEEKDIYDNSFRVFCECKENGY